MAGRFPDPGQLHRPAAVSGQQPEQFGQRFGAVTADLDLFARSQVAHRLEDMQQGEGIAVAVQVEVAHAGSWLVLCRHARG